MTSETICIVQLFHGDTLVLTKKIWRKRSSSGRRSSHRTTSSFAPVTMTMRIKTLREIRSIPISTMMKIRMMMMMMLSFEETQALTQNTCYLSIKPNGSKTSYQNTVVKYACWTQLTRHQNMPFHYSSWLSRPMLITVLWVHSPPSMKLVQQSKKL